MLGSIFCALDIASSGNNRAFAVWPTEKGIVGRWVDWTGEVQARPLDSATDQQGDEASISKDLLDFANGKAELITPGWTTGIAAAVAAETNGQLTRNLHDSGHWEALAKVVLNDNYGDDLRWYYLGRAAEGMALCDTAERYYRTSKERSEKFSTRCLGIACHGFNFPQAVEYRLTALEAMRKAGKCSAPP